ncbi:MAG: hypothetical protein IJY37_01450, partial [Clostridia bacterium]|nr:hypothetical protein [Clostridia bacterium]
AYRVPIPGTTQLRGESPDLPASRATSDWISFYTKFFAVPQILKFCKALQCFFLTLRVQFL